MGWCTCSPCQRDCLLAALPDGFSCELLQSAPVSQLHDSFVVSLQPSIRPLCLAGEVVKCQKLWYNDPSFKEQALLSSINITMELIILKITAIIHQ
jgi:hypothetical protein